MKGFYSAKQAEILAGNPGGNSGCIYQTPEGKEVYVTEVGEKAHFPDAIDLGEVTAFVREVNPRRSPFAMPFHPMTWRG